MSNMKSIFYTFLGSKKGNFLSPLMWGEKF